MMADETGAGAPEDRTTTTTEAGAPEAPVSVSGQQQASGTPSADAGTLLGGGGAADAERPAAAPADWPEDWRTRLAGDDKGLLNKLGRYASPLDFAKAYRNLETKVTSGQLKTTLPDNATPEEVAAWRKEAGLPDSPEGYVPELGQGLVLGDADKPLVDGFKQAALDANMTPTQFNKALNWYFAETEKVRQQTEEADAGYKSQAEDVLRQEWGAEYRPNINAINNILEMAPDGTGERLLAGRTADGKRIGDDPGIIKWLAALAREFNPAMPHIPAGSGNPMKATGDRIAEIEAKMGTPEYWQNSRLQEEYRDLVEAREKYQSRSSAA